MTDKLIADNQDPCSVSQCGANAKCEERNGAITCKCLPNYFGNPFIACHLECVQNSDCDLSKACTNNKCVNPCNGACGSGASCDVINHYPVCFCDRGLKGDPFVYCQPQTDSKFNLLITHNTSKKIFFDQS